MIQNISRKSNRARRFRSIFKAAMDVLLVYPAVVLAVVLAWGGHFTFDGMAQAYVAEVSDFVGHPATDTQLSVHTCLAPTEQSKQTHLVTCKLWGYRLENKEAISAGLATGARLAYWFIVITGILFRTVIRWKEPNPPKDGYSTVDTSTRSIEA